MKLTPFGETARILRMRYDMKLKHMADAMGLSSSHLSGIEYGDKTLSPRHIEAAIEFFRSAGADSDDLRVLQRAALRTQSEVDVRQLQGDQRRLVAVFARALAQGKQPTDQMMMFLDSTVGSEHK